MKTNKIITILFLLFTIVMSSSCKKQIKEKTLDELIPKTHIGANTFGCLKDGVPYYTTLKGCWNCHLGVTYTLAIDYFTLSMDLINPRENMYFSIGFDHKSGTFPSFTNFGHYNTITFLKDVEKNGTIPNGVNWYETNDSVSGNIHVTHFDGNILAGTFNFDVQNKLGEIIHFTDGRFDITNQQ